MSTIVGHMICGLSANLECRSEMWCTRLAGNAGRKTSPKIRHLRTISQIWRAISSPLSHVLTIEKKLVEQQYLLHMYTQCGELRPTNCWDRFRSLGHLISTGFASWQGYCTTLWYSGRQPNFAALNRWRHLYSAGRWSRWALAHISSTNLYSALYCVCRSSCAQVGRCLTADHQHQLFPFYTVSQKRVPP